MLLIPLALAGCGGDDSSSEKSAEEPALEVPEGAVAFVDEVEDGEITQAEFDAAIEQTAARSGGKNSDALVPGTPQYDSSVVPALADLLLGVWVRGEAGERGIEVTETEIEAELETIIDEQFGGQKEFEKFLVDSKFSTEDARERVELQLLTQEIQDEVIAEAQGREEEREVVSEFQDEFVAKWRGRTVCSDALVEDGDGSIEDQLAERCSNYELPDVDEPPAELPVDPAEDPGEPSPVP